MPDQIVADPAPTALTDGPVARFDALRRRLSGTPATLPEIFSAGEAILALGQEVGTDAPPGMTPGLPAQRIAILGSLTTDFIARAVACAVAQEGVLPLIYQAPFGAYVQEVLDPSSGLHRFRPELVLICTDWRDLVESLPLNAGADALGEALDARAALFRQIWATLGDGLKARIVQHLPAPPTHLYRGLADRQAPASPHAQARALSDALLEAGQGRVTWIEMERLAAEIGTKRFATGKTFHAAKLPFDQRYLPEYIPHFRGAWRAACGRTKKVLVLDLDNTLWGGVIGDDGLEGIVLGPATNLGEAFVEWQRYAKDLRERGVILAVCSKNDPETARSAFAHAHSVLRADDFAAFECSWNDKASGLRRIAADINVGIDSLVFCDDNPAECELVRQALPEVAVVDLGTDPTAFIALLDAGHWFDLPAYTQEDFGRGEAYAARAKAKSEADAAPDFGAYLRTLRMQGRLWRPGEPDLARVVQLEGKTNQFNLTTRRYPEAEIRAFLGRADAAVFAFRLADKFGDHGLVSTVIAEEQDTDLRILSWLMSCRVFSRSAEQFILRGLLAEARARGMRRLVGEYLPTAKNGVVADLYARLGFAQDAATGLWLRDVDAPEDDLATHIAAVDTPNPAA